MQMYGVLVNAKKDYGIIKDRFNSGISDFGILFTAGDLAMVQD